MKAALIIGNRHYQDSRLAALTTPGRDAERLAAVLRDPDISEFDDVSVLLDESEPKLRRAIARFFSARTRDDLLLFYFSGHGVRDEDGALFLASPDTDMDLLSATSVPALFVRQELDRSRSRRVVVLLDCCNSGAFHHGAKSPVGASSGMMAALSAPSYGRIVLTATDAVQLAWEGQEVAGGSGESLFTRYVVKGLETGEADRDGDGRISINELYDYVYEQVVAVSSKQTPQRSADAETGSLFIARARSIRSVPLPPKLLARLNEPEAWIREAAIEQLKPYLSGSHPGLSKAAHEQLKRLAEHDDSRSVSRKADELLREHEKRISIVVTASGAVHAAQDIRKPKPRIFISYRREDAAGYALVIFQRLGELYGPRRLFRDSDKIAPGQNFVGVIRRELQTCAVMLVIIGPDWVSARDTRMDRGRLDNPDDFVRMEVAAALASDVMVIPVVVDGAEMPRADDLPADLKSLTRRYAIELTNARWDHDMDRLIQAIDLTFSEYAGKKDSPSADRDE